MEYRIDSEKVRVMGGEIIVWKVFSGKQEPSNYLKFVKDKVVYSSESIADCYAWIKVKQEGLMFKEESIEQLPCEHGSYRAGHSPFVACICNDCGEEL